MPETEISERFSRTPPSRLQSSRSEYRNLKGFSDFEYLDTLIRCDRSGRDGHTERKDFVPPCMPAQRKQFRCMIDFWHNKSANS